MACELLCLFLLAVIVHFLVEYVRRKPQIANIALKSVLVTGCDTGFGNMLAKSLDGLGCRVFAGCYTQKGAVELQNCSSQRVIIFLLDVTKTDSIKKAHKFITEILQPDEELRGLVNNAGISPSAYTAPEYLTKGDLQEVLNVNLLGMMAMTVHFLPLIASAKGRIVNTSSGAGRVAAAPNLLTYNVTKYGVEALSDGLRPHMKKYGCHVSIIQPGLYATNIFDLSEKRSRIQKAYDRMSHTDQEALGADYVDINFAIAKKNLETLASKNLQEVVDAYLHALFAVSPKKRYTCGPGAWIEITLSYMPSWVQDLVIPDQHQKLFPIPDLTRLFKSKSNH